ncbi:MAG: hypothetical protein FGF52_01015 [Candidatus Brockarchaeota archaeon]|nr:hypothetical protein [Candidatus Brockarchaeota archaeon]
MRVKFIKNIPLVENIRFELERVWSAPYVGLMLMLLILGCPGNAAPINVQESAFGIALSSMGGFKQLFLCLIAILTFANSFGRDIEQDVLMGELTLPVRKETLFAVKLIINFSVILLIDFISTLFSTWIITASIPLIPIMSMVLVDAISLLLIVSITILMSIVLKSRFGAVIVAIAIYFLENILLLSISSMISTVNPLNIDPTYILLKLVLLGEITVYTWGIILMHLLFPLALLSFAFFFMKVVLQLD